MDITLKFIGGIESQKNLFMILNLLVNIILLIIPFIIIKFNKEKIVIYISTIMTFSFIVLSFINISKVKKEYTQFSTSHISNSEETRFNKKFHLSKEGNNVVIIMLDRAESSYFEHILSDDPKLKNIYSGFTYYPNTISFNGHTLMASPSLYGGYEYTPEQINLKSDLLLSEKHIQSTLVLPRIFTEQLNFKLLCLIHLGAILVMLQICILQILMKK